MKKFLVAMVLLLSFTTVVKAADDKWFGFLEEPLGQMEMAGSFLGNDVVKIEVKAKEMEKPVLGIAFHLFYPGEDLKFLRYEPGDFLERGGDPIYLVTDKGNEIVFGETLKREDSFPVGDGTVMNLYFEITGKKEFLFEFRNGVVSTLETVRQDLDMVRWLNLYMDEEKQTLISQGEELDFLNETRGNGGESGTKIWQRGGNIALASIIAAFVIGVVIFLIQKFSRQKRTAKYVNL